MTRLVSVDGRVVAPEEAKVSVYDRGFLYGDSVFETLRTYGGAPFALKEHLTRLERSAKLVGIRIPVPLQQLEHELGELLQRAGSQESYIRLMITRGEGELGLAPSESSPLRVILVGPLMPPPLAHYERGIAVILHSARRATDATSARGAKVGNYLMSVLAMAEARAAGAHEALIVDADDQVLEGASSNVFAVIDGVLTTPPVSAGILPGITRALVLTLARERGVPVALRPLTAAELLTAEEVFISSSIRELLGVVRIADQTMGAGVPGLLTQELLVALRERVRSPAPLTLSLEA